MEQAEGQEAEQELLLGQQRIQEGQQRRVTLEAARDMGMLEGILIPVTNLQVVVVEEQVALERTNQGPHRVMVAQVSQILFQEVQHPMVEGVAAEHIHQMVQRQDQGVLEVGETVLPLAVQMDQMQQQIQEAAVAAEQETVDMEEVEDQEL